MRKGHFSLLANHVTISDISKKLIAAAREKECEAIGRWRKGCIRHFYWAVTSTQQHLGEVKYAKFEAFLSHILNKHTNLPNKLFNRCVHGVLSQPRLWLTKSK